MISLISLLENISNKPKAIFLSGAAGSGKTYISKQVLPTDFTVLNIDDEYENLLKKSGIGLQVKDFSPEDLSTAAKLMAQARKVTDEKYKNSLKTKFNIIIDGTGASSKVLLEKKHELESLGYDCLILMLYVSPLVSLERNENRSRSLMPSIVLRTWKGVYQNIEIYQREFGENFILINTNPPNYNVKFTPESVIPYFQNSLAKGKEKTPEERLKSKIEAEQLMNDIVKLQNINPKFVPLNVAKTKIIKFLNG